MIDYRRLPAQPAPPRLRVVKGKARTDQALLARLHREFNVAAAEVDHQDVWQSSEIAIVVGNEARHLQSELQHIVGWIEYNRPALEIVDAAFELR